MGLASDGTVRTGRELVVGAFRELGIIGGIESDPAPEDLNNGIDQLEELVDSWRLEYNLLPSLQRHEIVSETAKSAYRIGAVGADLVIPRPTYIHSVTWRPTADAVEVPLDSLAWTDWVEFDKTTTGPPSRWFYDSGIANSATDRTVGRDDDIPALLATLHVLPVPGSSGVITIYAPSTVADFSGLNTKVVLPPGFARAIRLNLAVSLYRSYQRDSSRDIVALRRDAKVAINKIVNATSTARGQRSAETIFPAGRAVYPLGGFGSGFEGF